MSAYGKNYVHHRTKMTVICKPDIKLKQTIFYCENIGEWIYKKYNYYILLHKIVKQEFQNRQT